jgi:glycosyltransferase involved in cell wall biosynthesis
MTFFSVIIPLYNKRPFIRRAVDSVLNQTFADFELIVVDDGSTDGSAEAIQDIDDPRLHTVRQENRGVGGARNAGIVMSHGDWLAFLDADDEWLPQHLEELRLVAEMNPEVGMISTRGRTVTTENALLVRARAHRQGQIIKVNYFLRAGRDKGFINSSCVALRRDIVEQIGSFSKRKAGEDIEYWVRVALRFPVAASDRVTSLYYRDTGGVMQQMGPQRLTQPGGELPELPTFSAGVAVIYEQAEQEPDLLLRSDIRTYINGMLIVGVRMALYHSDFLLARHYAGMFLPPIGVRGRLIRLILFFPDRLLRAVRTIVKYLKLQMRAISVI